MNTGRVDLPVFDDSFPNCLTALAALANRPNHDYFAFDFRRFKVVLIRRYFECFRGHVFQALCGKFENEIETAVVKLIKCGDVPLQMRLHEPPFERISLSNGSGKQDGHPWRMVGSR